MGFSGAAEWWAEFSGAVAWWAEFSGAVAWWISERCAGLWAWGRAQGPPASGQASALEDHGSKEVLEKLRRFYIPWSGAVRDDVHVLVMLL